MQLFDLAKLINLNRINKQVWIVKTPQKKNQRLFRRAESADGEGSNYIEERAKDVGSPN